MKVLLINPPIRYQGKRRDEIFFPLGLGYVAGALMDQGHEVIALDIHALNLPDNEVVAFISNATFDVVGIGAMSTQYNYVKWLSTKIKDIHKDKKIILGWVLALYSSEIVLKNTDVDVCVIGEGENTIKDLLRCLDNPENVNGLAYKKDGHIIFTPPRDYIDDLNTLPSIPFDLFPMEMYIESLSSRFVGDERTINISAGRGCPYHCTFCSKSFSGVRLRTVESIVGEIDFLKSRFGIQRVFFLDELLVINKKRILSLCEKIRNMNVTWVCQGRINLVDEEILERMKSAGCVGIGYGVESGSQKILDAMNKKIDVNRAEEIIKLTKKIGIIPILQFIFGYPGENLETIRDTIDFFRRIDVGEIEFSPITPLPGTELWDYSIQNKIIQDEAGFLEKLDGGYMGDSPVLVNFTSFSDDELNRLRRWAENTIRLNYIKRHPFRIIEAIHSEMRKEGIRHTYQKIKRRLSF